MKTLPEGLLEAMTKALVDELDPEAIYLFGSHAWGEPDEDSDVDLMVIVDEDDARERTQISDRARRALRPFDISKDVLLRSRERFERFSKAISSLEYDVVTDGRKLYVRGR